MIRIVLMLLAGCMSFASAGQTITINGEEGDRPLTWKDFKARPDKSSSFAAMTYWSVSWEYDNVRFDGNKALFHTNVNVSFGKDSWVKNPIATPALLKHEQGHFDIAKLYGLELADRLRHTTFYKHSYKEAVREIYNALDRKYRQLQHRYDEETDHHQNTEAQARWDARLAQEYARYAN